MYTTLVFKNKLLQDDECITTKHVTAVTLKTDILLSQTSVHVSVLIEHLSSRATPSNGILTIPKKTDGNASTVQHCRIH